MIISDFWSCAAEDGKDASTKSSNLFSVLDLTVIQYDSASQASVGKLQNEAELFSSVETKKFQLESIIEAHSEVGDIYLRATWIDLMPARSSLRK